MKFFSDKKTSNIVNNFANFQFLISNFYSISNVSMSKFLKRVVALFGNLKIENSLEIRNSKLEIWGVPKNVLASDAKLICENSLI